MSITFTPYGLRVERISRELGAITGTLTISGAYTPGAGGLTLPTTLSRLFKGASATNIKALKFEDIAGGIYKLQHVQSTGYVKVFREAPPVVVEEQLAVASNTCTLSHPPAYINYVCGGAADYNSPFRVIAGDAGAANVAASQVHVNMATGVLTFKSTDSVAICRVSYITKAAKVFADNLVEESVTIAAAGTDLANKAVAIQNVTSIRTGVVPTALLMSTDGCNTGGGADTPNSGEVSIDWVSGSYTNLKTHADDDAKAGYVTYIKNPASGLLNDRFVQEEADIVGGADLIESDYPILALSTGGVIPCSDKVSQALVGKGGTLGAGEACPVMSTLGYGMLGSGLPNQFTLKSDLDPTNGVLSYVWGYPHELQTQLIEPYVASGTIWSGVVTAIGLLP